MNKFILILITGILILNFMQCNPTERQKEELIELNSGEKWKINEEMIPFVINSEEMINQYDGNFALLAQNLKEQNAGLIKSCTMDGQSHEELHKWLHPHIEKVKELENATEPAVADEVVEDLKKSLKVYHEYFE